MNLVTEAFRCAERARLGCTKPKGSGAARDVVQRGEEGMHWGRQV